MCPRYGRNRPKADAGLANENGGNPTGSGHCAHGRLHHRGHSSAGDSHPHRRACRAATDQPGPPVDALPDWEAFVQPSPGYVFDQNAEW